MRLTHIALAGSLLCFTACGNSGENNTATNTAETGTTTTVTRPPAQSKLNAEGTQALMDVMAKYYTLKNALVATKSTRADSAARQLTSAAESLQAMLQKDSANYTGIKLYIDTVVSHSKMITTYKDETCEQQRIVFEHVSSALYALLKQVDIKNAGVYHAYCPMAFNDKGAYWLSEESEIKNPYFGKKMLECGEVTDSL